MTEIGRHSWFVEEKDTKIIDQEHRRSLITVLERMDVAELPLGTPGWPDSGVLPVEELDKLIDTQLGFYGPERAMGFVPRVYRSESRGDIGAMSHPAVSVGKSVYELLFVSWDKEKSDWQLVVAESGKHGVRVLDFSPQEALEKLRRPKSLPVSLFMEKEAVLCEELDEGENFPIKRWMNNILYEARSLRPGAEVVMIVSNADAKINGSRSRTACHLWSVLDRIAAGTNQERPSLICNGRDWEVAQMKSIAWCSGVPPDRVKTVVLGEKEATIHHASRMVEQMRGELPKDLVYVTSTEHLVRAGWLLWKGFSGHGEKISLYPFEAPSLPNVSLEPLQHEVLRLSEHELMLLRENMPGLNWEIPPSRPIWARVAAGWPLPV